MTARLRRRSERGAAAVEFALVVPLLLFLLFGIISYGYMLSFRQGLSQAAAEGARSAAVAPSSEQDPDRESGAIDAIVQALASYGVSCDTSGNLIRDAVDVGACTVTISTCPDSTARCASVTLDYEYSTNPLLPSVPGLGLLLPDHLEYTAVSEVS